MAAHVLAVVLALAQGAAPGDARALQWTGAWRADGPKLHATLVIADVDAKGFAVSWDEGVGDQGVRERGTAAWIAGGRARFTSAGCKLTLAREADGRLTGTVATESCFNWASPGKVTFVREDAAPAGADCAKATTSIDRALCADPDLGAAARRLAVLQREKLSRHGGGIAASERRSLDRRQALCGEAPQPRECLLREFGRRMLELHAWPAAPFLPDGRPELGVLQAILRDDAARPASGIRELVAGIVGGAPDDITLALNQDDEGIWLSGCDRVDGAVPPAADCTRAHYVAFLKNGETWAAWTKDKEITVAPSPEKDQALPASLHAFARGQEKPPEPR
ncbi:MAG: hypothetical protein ABW221_09020 [Vicinamibacteria bacterium]